MNNDELSPGGHEPTISDVAGVAGVSIRTVSRVINNLPRVSESTSERVYQAINTLKFQPSLGARGGARSPLALFTTIAMRWFSTRVGDRSQSAITAGASKHLGIKSLVGRTSPISIS